MCTISEMRKRLQSINIPKIAEKAFNSTAAYAAMELRAQWALGRGGNGPFPDYSKASIEKYKKQPGPWKLYDTGSLSRKIFFKAKDGVVESFSKDSKAEMIEARLTGFYSPMGTGKDYAPFKLNKESRADFLPILEKAFIEEAKKKLQL